MALSDFVLKAKVNMALVRDPRVGSLDVGVQAEDGLVTLTGDVDTLAECHAAEQAARRVDGVRDVRNEITCGIGQRADSAEMVTQKFLERLDDAWNELPDQNALTQADYLRWALWMVYKFRLPASIASRAEDGRDLEMDAVESALAKVAGYVGAPKAIVALEMLRQAEWMSAQVSQDAPEITHAPLVATPVVDSLDDTRIEKAA